MASQINPAERREALAAIAEGALEAKVLKFNAHGVAVLQLPLGAELTAEVSEKWDRLVTAARREELVKYVADGLAVLCVFEVL